MGRWRDRLKGSQGLSGTTHAFVDPGVATLHCEVDVEAIALRDQITLLGNNPCSTICRGIKKRLAMSTFSSGV